MSESSLSSAAKLYAERLAFLTPVSLAISTAYLYGYWALFKIDPFEFIDIGDIIKLSIPTLVGVVVLVSPMVYGFRKMKRYTDLVPKKVVLLLMTIGFILTSFSSGTNFLGYIAGMPFMYVWLSVDRAPDGDKQKMLELATLTILLVMLAFLSGVGKASGTVGGDALVLNLTRSKLVDPQSVRGETIYIGRLGKTTFGAELRSQSILIINDGAKVPLYAVHKKLNESIRSTIDDKSIWSFIADGR